MIRPRLAAATCAVLLASVGIQPAAAIPVPTDPDHPSVASTWANPSVRPNDGLRGELLLIDAPLSTPAANPAMFHVKLRVTNHSDGVLEGLSVTSRRGPATGSVTDQRVATVAQVGEYSKVGQRVDVPGALQPGDSTDVEFDVELPMDWVGAYPVMLQLTDADGTTLDTERFHLNTRGAPSEEMAPGGLTALYPISAAVDILPGETGDAPMDPPLILASEQLARQIAPGGRLDQLAETYLDAIADPDTGEDVSNAVCAAIDPALIDTVDRMSRGYTVSHKRPPVVEEPKRLRDSWSSDTKAELGLPGIGSEDAAAWLDKMRQISASGCTVALPWANTDLNAVAQTGDPWLMREAIERGPFTLERILGQTGVLNTVVPATGYVADDVAPALGWADHTRSRIQEEGLSGAWENAVQAATEEVGGSAKSALERQEQAAPDWAAAPEPTVPVRVLTAGSETNGAWLAPGVASLDYNAALNATLAQMGQTPSTMAYTNPAYRFNYAKDSKLARDINAVAAIQLAASQAMVPVPEMPETPAQEPEPNTNNVLLNPPASWDADSAAALLGSIAYLTAEGFSRPEGLAQRVLRMDVAPNTEPLLVDDGATYSDAEILSATQQARFINDLSTLLASDSSIALTRYGFTLPLRRDILTAFAPTGRRSIGGYADAAAVTTDRLTASRAELSTLRAAVTLIPPGNVYTRTSPSSPLLIVAQNGMPLPVDTTIGYVAADGARLNVPETFRIPARGSVTVTMTADLPQNSRDTTLQLFLAGKQGQAISQPVDIAVRTPSLALSGWVLVLGAFVLFALFALIGMGARRRRRGLAPPSSISRKPPTTTNPNGAAT